MSSASSASDTDRPVVLVDGSAYLYRAFHAMPPLTNSKGQPTGAIYGVVNMLRRLVADYQPRYMAVIFDASGKTFRDEIYSEYKSNRASMPDDMRLQIEPLHKVVQTMGFPLLSVTGVEADDVIGTLCVKASEKGFKTIVSTGDKDMAQLVNENVTLVNTMALVGDTSDNIPGVPSCGPKTAAKWLAAYGSLQSIIDNAEAVKGKIGEKLRDAIPHLPMSYELATIRLDVELDTSVEQLTLSEPDAQALAALYEDLEFKTWARELADGMSPLQTRAAQGGAPAKPDTPAASSADNQYETITSMEELDRWIEQLETATLFAFDTETTSLDYMQAQVVGLSFALSAGQAAYVPLAHDYDGAPEQLDRDAVLAKFKPLLEGDKRNLVGQHIKYDINVLANHGVNLVNVAHDTMLMSYVLDSTATRHDMDSLAKKYLNVATIKFEEVAGKGKAQKTFNEVDVQVASRYAAEDADITLQLYEALWPRLKSESTLLALYEEVEIPALHVLSRIERTGVRIDDAMLAKQGDKLAATILDVKAAAYEDAGREFNLGSPKQIGEIFFEEKQFPVIRKTPKGQPSTAEDVLEQLALDYPLPRLILQHRTLTKLMSTYIEKLPSQINPGTGRVHTSYNQAVASTGRLLSAFGLAKQLDIARGEAQQYIDLYFDRYPGVKRYMDETRALAKEQGYVETVFGRRLYLPDINARNAQMRNYAERTAINAPMQGTEADIIKRARITVNDSLVDDAVDARIIMQVHDELVLEVASGQLDEVGERVRKLMVEAATLKVALEVDVGIGNSWEEAH